MQGLRIGSVNPAWVALANEAEPTVEREALVGLANELAIGSDGWAVVPYGEWPNERGLQRFGRPQAEKMVGYFKNAWSRIKRVFVGMPVLKGHPDMVDTVRGELQRTQDPAKRRSLEAMINTIAQRWPDRTVYGTIADMEARESGLALKLILTEEGAALVNEGGLKFFSPHWLASEEVGADGRAVKTPIYLVSVGLTDRPNIAGTSLVNEEPSASTASAAPVAAPADFFALTEMNKPILLQLLAALGQALAVDASDEQINAALAAVAPAVAALAARPEPAALVNEQSARTAAETALAEVRTALANEQAAHAAAVVARNTALVNEAVLAGRITHAVAPVWLARLQRDFATESVALANEQSGPKVVARTAHMGGRKPSNAAASTEFTALVNEELPKHGGNYLAAWEAAKRSPKGKALLAAMDAANEAAATDADAATATT